MSRADRIEVPGLIDSLQPGDSIVIEGSMGNPKIRTFVAKDSRFVHTRDKDEKFMQMWHRYSVMKKAQPRRIIPLYTDM
jgi:hypothetical protein